MSRTPLDEDVPVMSAGSGQIAGIGVGPQGEPGVKLPRKRRREMDEETKLWKYNKRSGYWDYQRTIASPNDEQTWLNTFQQDEPGEHFVLSRIRPSKKPKLQETSLSDVAMTIAHERDLTSEDLRDWFGAGKEGGIGGGGWDRYNTQGERIGKCGGADERGGEGEGKPKCLSKEKAAQLRAQGGKTAIANAVKRKKAQDPVTNRKGTGNAPRPVSNRIGEAPQYSLNKDTLLRNIHALNPEQADMLVKRLFGWQYSADEINGRKRITKALSQWAQPVKVAIANTWKDAISQVPGHKVPLFAGREMTPLHEKNTPTDPDLWSRAKSEAKKRFDVYPSAYANGWAAKWYKERGGGWRTEKNEANTPASREWGTDSLVDVYKHDTPGELREMQETLAMLTDAWQKITTCQQCGTKLSSRDLSRGARVCDKCVKTNKGRVWGNDADDLHEAAKPFTQGDHVVLLAVPANTGQGDGKGYWKVGKDVFRAPIKNVLFDIKGEPMDKRWESTFAHFKRTFESTLGQYYKKAPTWKATLKEEDSTETLDIIREALTQNEGCGCDEPSVTEASEYQGRKVTLGKPFRTPDGPKKFSVYVRNDKGNVVKVNFGDPNMEIKRDDPNRRKNFRARHNCDTPGPRWKARYWSCRWGWGRKPLDEQNKFVSPHAVNTIIPIANPKWKSVKQAKLVRKSPNGDDWRAQTASGSEVFTLTWPDVQAYASKK